MMWSVRASASGPVFSDVNIPFRIVTVDTQGGWSTYCPELMALGSADYRNFRLGNLAAGPISTHSDPAPFRALEAGIKAGVARCRAACEYFPVCGGGRPSNKYAEHRSFDVAETRHCAVAVKALADACVNHLGRYMAAPAAAAHAAADTGAIGTTVHVVKVPDALLHAVERFVSIRANGYRRLPDTDTATPEHAALAAAIRAAFDAEAALHFVGQQVEPPGRDTLTINEETRRSAASARVEGGLRVAPARFRANSEQRTCRMGWKIVVVPAKAGTHPSSDVRMWQISLVRRRRVGPRFRGDDKFG